MKYWTIYILNSISGKMLKVTETYASDREEAFADAEAISADWFENQKTVIRVEEGRLHG
jgi:hypothetical protein